MEDLIKALRVELMKPCMTHADRERIRRSIENLDYTHRGYLRYGREMGTVLIWDRYGPADQEERWDTWVEFAREPERPDPYDDWEIAA